MNREIKFRVWDKDMKCWWCEDSQYLQMDGKKIHPAPWSTLSADLPDERIIVQQYTGLKDKNGKMIFEGDILRQNDLRFEIRFESFQWVAVCPYYNKYHHPRIEHFRLCVSGEVVGNIMENPELLKA